MCIFGHDLVYIVILLTFHYFVTIFTHLRSILYFGKRMLNNCTTVYAWLQIFKQTNLSTLVWHRQLTGSRKVLQLMYYSSYLPQFTRIAYPDPDCTRCFVACTSQLTTSVRWRDRNKCWQMHCKTETPALLPPTSFEECLCMCGRSFHWGRATWNASKKGRGAQRSV